MIMTRKPFFSIVIPTYNRSADLRFALFCILRQRFDDYEIVVSDNCSTDNTKEVVDRFNDVRIRYCRNHVNIGMIANQKAAIEKAQGRYIFLLGDDDVLVYDTSLDEIYQEIIKRYPGYIRVNYASISFDKRHIFTYKVNKPLQSNFYLPPRCANEDVMSFIIDSDNYFYSGIVMRNTFPPGVHMIDADPSPWIDMVFHVAKRFGGYFIYKRHILALWSRRMKKSEDHGFYVPVEGAVKAEKYFLSLKDKLTQAAYKKFLQREIKTIYVNLFPAIKASVGNKHLATIDRRIRQLAPELSASFWYRMRLIAYFIIPARVLGIVKDVYLWLYMRLARVDEERQLMRQLKELEEEYAVAL